MYIQVTQEDIDEGTARNCYNCPIARAVQRQYPRPKRHRGSLVVSADPEEIRVFINDGSSLNSYAVHKLDPEAARWMSLFDSAAIQKEEFLGGPFGFELGENVYGRE